jgi:superfamily I DNA/RNA helicase
MDGVKGTEVLPLIELDAPLIRVEAGPGTGKTFGLVRRVQRLVHPQGGCADGREVLVVAFNRVIAEALRHDIGKCLDESEHLGDPVIRTVHALCLQAIGGDLRILLPHEREAMIYDVLEAHPALRVTGQPFEHADQALRDHEAKHVLNVSLWQAVQEWLTRHQARLISELPSLLLDRLDGGDFDTKRYQHVIVDEFQDLTEGEQRLFATLVSPGGSLVALGDPRQSIYLFRGNDREGLEKLDVIGHEEVTDVAMSECQRCPASIVQAANQLMSLYSAAPMIPVSDRVANTHVVVWETPHDEAVGMAKAIVDNVRAHPNDSHLVMVTRRRFGYWLRDAMNALDSEVSVDLSFSESLLETWAVREAFIAFCLLVDPDAPTWRAWLAYRDSQSGTTFKAPNRNAGAYLALLTQHGDTITWGAVESLAAEERSLRRGSGGAILWDRAVRLLEIRGFVGTDLSAPDAWLDLLFDPSIWITEETDEPDIAATDLMLVREKVREIIAEGDSGDSLDDAADRLQRAARLLRYQIATREQFTSSAEAAVQVATLWGAKGVTADHVYVLGLCKEAIPGNRRVEYPGTDLEFSEEQRRLFYVTLTRARSTLVLSRARKIKRGEAKAKGVGLDVSAGGGWYPTLEMSPFLRDILSFLPRGVSGDSWPGCALH